MDVIGQALWFAIQVTWWLMQQAFFLSCKFTKLVFETVLYKLFGGALVQSNVVIIAVSAVIWTPILMLFFVLTGGAEGMLTGLVLGPIWGGATGMNAIRSWEEDAARMQSFEEPEQHTLLDRPLNVVSQKDDDQPEPEIDLSYFDSLDQEVSVEDRE